MGFPSRDRAMPPRPLTELERDTLMRLLSASFPGAEEYRQQVGDCHVSAMCPCGCATIDLEVDKSRAPRSPVPGTPLLPVEGRAEDDEGQPHELILFARDGWLFSLEIVYYGAEVPTTFPDPAAWAVTPTIAP